MNIRYSHDSSSAFTPENPDYRKCIFNHIFNQLMLDIGNRDITTDALFPKDKKTTAKIRVQESGVLAGRQEVEFLAAKKLQIEFKKKDGQNFRGGETIAILKGNARTIFEFERTILNALGRMSGIATFASRIIKKVHAVNPRILVCPTRKTHWGLLDKRAVWLAGGGTHRLNLSDAVLIKDNHLDSYKRDIERASALLLFKLRGKRQPRFIEIEVETADEALRAARAFNGIKIPFFIMFDNMKPAQIRASVKKLVTSGLRKNIGLEASGGIMEKNIAAYALTGVDIISMGALTQSVSALNFTMTLIPH